MFLTKRPSAISSESRFPSSCDNPSKSIPASFLACSGEPDLKSLASTNVMIGLGCLPESNGAPGGGVWANSVVETQVTTRNVAVRNIGNIIIDSMRGTVRALFIQPKKGGTSVSLNSVQAVIGGFDGDYHA